MAYRYGWKNICLFVNLRVYTKKGSIMAQDDLVKKLEKLAIDKSRIEQKQALLRKKKEKKEVGKLIEIGKLALQAGILSLDRETLLGAFLDIASRTTDEKTLSNWKKSGEKALLSNKQDLIISFAEVTSNEINNLMTSHSFRWNRFRKEWYGKGEKEMLEKILEGKNAKIEVITD